jgi:hypothetical protein
MQCVISNIIATAASNEGLCDFQTSKSTPKAFERLTGDPNAVHVGLRSRVEREGFPSGYDFALAPQAIDRLSDIGATYGLGVVGKLRYGAGEYEQPTVSSKFEAANLAQQASMALEGDDRPGSARRGRTNGGDRGGM